LKVGSNRDGKIEKNVVKNIEKGHQSLGFDSGVGQEYEYKAGIFQGEDLSFTESDQVLFACPPFPLFFDLSALKR